MPPPLLDIVILGGGPAGAVAARLLATWGWSVELLTRPSRARALVESLPPSCSKVLDHTGLREAVDRAAFIRTTGNTVWWGPESGRSEPFAGGRTGYQVPRARFDRLLLDEAVRAGAMVHRATTVLRVEHPRESGGPHVVHAEADGESRTLAARWVLDCTGRSGVTARRGWRTPEPGRRTTALVAVWERGDGWPVDDQTHTLVESWGEGWAWSVPDSVVRRYVAVMVDPTLTPLAGGDRLAAVYHGELRRTTHVGPMLKHARMIGRPWARDASPYAAAVAGEPGLLLVGDAASFADPLSSFGVKKALVTAWLASVVVRTSLEDPALAPAALELYRRRERAIADALRRQSVEFSRAASGIYAGPYWERRAADDATEDDEPDVRALRHDPDVFEAFQELKRRESVRLLPSRHLRREGRPGIQQDRVVRQEQLVAPAFPTGIRYLRDIDLVRLVDLAGENDQVPRLFEAYCRAAPPVPLPDFLGALSVLIGKGCLEFA